METKKELIKELIKEIKNVKLQIEEGKLTGSKSKFYEDMKIKLEKLKQKLKGDEK